MPFPFLAALGGLGSLIGAGAGAYGLATSIRDRNESKRKQKAFEESQKRMNEAAKKAGNPVAGLSSSPQGLPGGVGTYSVYSPQQQAALNTVLLNSIGSLGKNQFDFAPIEQQARQGFAQQTVPSIAERFTAMGSGPGSSGFNRAVAQAGKGLETDLASMKSGYNLQQQALMQNLLRLGLTPQYEAYLRPGDVGFGKSLFGQQNLGDILNLAGKGIDYFANRPRSQPGSGNINDNDIGSAGFQAPGISPSSRLGAMQNLNPGSFGQESVQDDLYRAYLAQGVRNYPLSAGLNLAAGPQNQMLQGMGKLGGVQAPNINEQLKVAHLPSRYRDPLMDFPI